eukprot:UN09667
MNEWMIVIRKNVLMNKMSISHFNGKAKHQIAWAAHSSINIQIVYQLGLIHFTIIGAASVVKPMYQRQLCRL